MYANFVFAANAVMPLVLMIGLGYYLGHSGILGREFFRGGNWLLYHVLLPCSLYTNIYSMSGISSIRWDVAIYTVAATVLLCLLGELTAPLFVSERESRGPAIQCVFRSNAAFIGTALAASLGGDAASRVFSVALAFTVPLFSFLGVLVLTRYGGDAGKKHGFGAMALEMLLNPLIFSSLLAFLTLALRTLIPTGADGQRVFLIERDLPFVFKTLKQLGGITSPLAMVVMGGLLDLSAVKGKLKPIIYGAVWRLVLAPVICIGAAVLLTRRGVLNFGAPEFASILPLFGAPVSVSSAVLAAEMGVDAELARQCVVWTSVALVVTLPVEIMVMRSMGLL